jgi:Cu/Zn superoxide dismutase
MRVGSALVFALAIASAMLFGLSSPASAQGQSITLSLVSQNNSGITGTVVITELPGGKIRVEVRANGSGPGPQPSHIHQGTCANLDPAPQFTLSSLTNGVSTTEVDGSLHDITAAPHAIHLHKAPDELPVYVACADIRADGGAAGQPRTLPSSGAASIRSPWPSALAAVGLIVVGLGIGCRTRRRNRRLDNG